MALVATQAAPPDWFKHGETAESVEPLLRNAAASAQPASSQHAAK
jgi:hypothetical protein